MLVAPGGNRDWQQGWDHGNGDQGQGGGRGGKAPREEKGKGQGGNRGGQASRGKGKAKGGVECLLRLISLTTLEY